MKREDDLPKHEGGGCLDGEKLRYQDDEDCDDGVCLDGGKPADQDDDVFGTTHKPHNVSDHADVNGRNMNSSDTLLPFVFRLDGVDGGEIPDNGVEFLFDQLNAKIKSLVTKHFNYDVDEEVARGIANSHWPSPFPSDAWNMESARPQSPRGSRPWSRT